MSTRTQLIASMRKSVEELDEKIADAERRCEGLPHNVEAPLYVVEALHDERDTLIRKIEEAEEADDLIHDLLCAISDAYDGEPLTEGALRAQLENHGLQVSRIDPLAKYRGAPGQTCAPDAKAYTMEHKP